MRLVAVALVALLITSGCAGARLSPRLTLRDGPIAVGAELLATPEAQRRHFGRPLDGRLLARLVPVTLALENAGTRELVVLPSDIVLDLPGQRLPPLHAHALAAAFAETLDETSRTRPLPKGRPERSRAAQELVDLGAVICVATVFGCFVVLPLMVLGGVVNEVEDQVDRAQGRAAVYAVQRRVDALATVEAVVLAPGATIRGTLYFGVAAGELAGQRPPALVVRFTDRASGAVAVVVRLDLEGVPAER